MCGVVCGCWQEAEKEVGGGVWKASEVGEFGFGF